MSNIMTFIEKCPINRCVLNQLPIIEMLNHRLN